MQVSIILKAPEKRKFYLMLSLETLNLEITMKTFQKVKHTCCYAYLHCMLHVEVPLKDL